jgi:hypothetical protein
MVLPYLKGLVIIKCGFFYLALWIYCVFSICGDYIGRSIQVLNKVEGTFERTSIEGDVVADTTPHAIDSIKSMEAILQEYRLRNQELPT